MTSDAKTPISFIGDTSSTEDVIITDTGNCSIITLNRPKALNSLTFSMIQTLSDQLKINEQSSTVYTTIVRSEGAAFCAGGDVKALYLKRLENSKEGVAYGKNFFRSEYTMNHFIASMKSNYVAIMNGITMGGGVGISLPARFNIATETTRWAMPETAIGLFPDIGASFFLSRLQGQLGMYLALTGSSLIGADTLHAGVATHFIPSHLLVRVVERIQEVEYDAESVLNAISERARKPEPSPEFTEALPIINKCFSEGSVESIIEALRATKTSFGDAVVARLAKMSPLSLKLTFKELRAGRGLSLEQCLQMEYRLASHSLDGNEFYEGVRAALIDKDRSPNWQYPSLASVSNSVVDSFFFPVPDELILTRIGSRL